MRTFRLDAIVFRHRNRAQDLFPRRSDVKASAQGLLELKIDRLGWPDPPRVGVNAQNPTRIPSQNRPAGQSSYLVVRRGASVG